MSDKKVLSVSLKDEFNMLQCLDVGERIRGMKGVESAHAMPEGCFGIDAHKLVVTHDGKSDVAKEIAKMPEVKSVKRGYNF